ncbi:MerR HTH family regulatory protein [Parafrankia irregularis]|uniref:MerR HTH family regulatory protein n=1 Tax=Parafrankia irregularis TaxID=795642 RepID=A0A0S4QQW7_9ACTN|nr:MULTISPECIES: chaperone modulator CbpM [Parafrankia]MBE3206188.1 hypothetical protein [Parafrankia sp. CH37]CUU57593.1 MerR HTH family regulatory protein [Parafrankia irregularis]
MNALLVRVQPRGDRPAGRGTAGPDGPGRPERPGDTGDPERLELDAFCAVTHLHPDLVRRLVALGLLDAETDPGGRYVLEARAVARAGRIERLRRDLGITYTASGVVLDLLDRIDDLERLLRAARPARGEVLHRWT